MNSTKDYLEEHYEEIAFAEMSSWLAKNHKRPSILNLITKGTQKTINQIIPQKVHRVITFAIENMIKGLLFGTKYITPKPMEGLKLKEREEKVDRIIKFYKNTASAEGAITGAGGILMGFADFPAFLSIKIKMLCEIAAAYGIDVKSFQERLFMLYFFKLAFSSQESRNETVKVIEDWDAHTALLPMDEADFDWMEFQLEYRDYMDLAKLAQLIPVIGAGVGAVANYQLSALLGETAKQCYRVRYFKWDL
jgi:uncharacterized protein (DUF697 family)